MEPAQKNNRTTNFWHQQFLKVFGKPAYDIHVKDWFDDLFVYSYVFCAKPPGDDTPIVTASPTDRKLSLHSAGNIDVHVEFHQALTVNKMLMCAGFYDIELNFDENGLMVDGSP